jgi:hypothetical protein
MSVLQKRFKKNRPLGRFGEVTYVKLMTELLRLYEVSIDELLQVTSPFSMFDAAVFAALNI